MNRHQRMGILIGIVCAAIAITFMFPGVEQDPEYHNLTDRRIIWGIPNFGDVISNSAFLLVGALGIRLLCQVRNDTSRLISAKEAVPFWVAFAGIVLIFLGSSYYHLAPSNATLVWDRLPMTLVFMSIFGMILAERLKFSSIIPLQIFLLIIGIGSILYWNITELSGQGDLRPYGLVQFLPLLLYPFLFVMFRPLYTGTRYLVEMLGLYLLAKVMEFYDAEIWSWTGETISGHSLKHLVAAGATYSLVRYLKYRRAVAVGVD